MSAELLSYAEAHTRVTSFAREAGLTKLPVEQVDLADATSRVLAQTIVADLDQPPFARSTRDGFACRAAEISTYAALRIAGTIQAGEAPAAPLPAGCVWEIMTGAPVPEGADAVVMLEHVEREGERISMSLNRFLRPGDNLVAAGAQGRRGETLVSAGVEIGPAQIALAAACGLPRLTVYKKRRVAILATGNELVSVDEEPGPGQIRNSNAPMLAALVARAGADPWVLPAAADTPDALDCALRTALDADLLLISGGVSAGKFDLVEPALARLGARFHFTGVRIQPGKPLVFGEVPRAEASPLPFFGLPGNPISSAATFLLFASQVVRGLAGCSEWEPRFLAAQMEQETDRRGKPGLTRFLPAYWTVDSTVHQVPQVAMVPWNGSSDLPAFARSNCFVMVPEDVGSLEAGTMVKILLF